MYNLISYFSKTKDENSSFDETENKQELDTSSSLGRAYTSINKAKSDIYKKHVSYDALKFINTKTQFFGMNIFTKKAVYLPFADSTHMLYCGPTRCQKGVALGHRAVETIKQKKGLIVIDPKRDNFLSQIIFEELERQNRTDDMFIATYPENFGYSGFNSDDTHQELSNKLINALSLEPANDPKSDYYKRNERTLLKKVTKVFLNSKEYLNTSFDLDFKNILLLIKTIKSDLNSSVLLSKEQAKARPNFALIERYSKRYYDEDMLMNIDICANDIDTLAGLYQSIEELDDANIFTKINIDEALYNNKVVYIQIDQLDEASLKIAKILQVDILQKSKKKKANCNVIADEVSFYANKTLASSLSTIAGFGVTYILAFQDIAQLTDDEIKNSILSNCQTKFFYKSSDLATLNYIEKLSGKELVTQMSKNEYSVSIRQTQEEYFNITKLRAMRRDRVSVMIAESLASPFFVQTWHIEVRQEFSWSEHLSASNEIKRVSMHKNHTVSNFQKESISDEKNRAIGEL